MFAAGRQVSSLDPSGEPVREHPLCSVIVCTRHRTTKLARCLTALRSLDYPRYELIVVDNTVGDEKVRRLADSADAFRVVEPRAGLSRARNAGARAAGGEIIAFIDDDAVARPDWLRRHAAAFADQSLGATTGRVLPMAEASPAAQNWTASVEDLGEESLRIDRTSSNWFERVNFGGIGLGSNMAFRSGLFENGWAFRESLGLGERDQPLGEEHYAFFTLINAGHAVAYVPDAVVYHDGPASMSDLRLKRRRLVRGSTAYFVMLLVEHPEFRKRTLRYGLTALRGKRRYWRTAAPATMPFLRRRELVAAMLSAPWRYWRSRRASSSRMR